MGKVSNRSSCSCPLCKYDNISIRLKRVVKGRHWYKLDAHGYKYRQYKKFKLNKHSNVYIPQLNLPF